MDLRDQAIIGQVTNVQVCVKKKFWHGSISRVLELLVYVIWDILQISCIQMIKTVPIEQFNIKQIKACKMVRFLYRPAKELSKKMKQRLSYMVLESTGLMINITT